MSIFKKKTSIGELKIGDPKDDSIMAAFGFDSEWLGEQCDTLEKLLLINSLTEDEKHSKVEVFKNFLSVSGLQLKTANDYFMAGFLFSSAIVIARHRSEHLLHDHEEEPERIGGAALGIKMPNGHPATKKVEAIMKKKIDEMKQEIERETGGTVEMVHEDMRDSFLEKPKKKRVVN